MIMKYLSILAIGVAIIGTAWSECSEIRSAVSCTKAQKVQGCEWNNKDNRCVQRAATCADYKDSNMCVRKSERKCEWVNDKCRVKCGFKVREADCDRVSHCSWRNNLCVTAS